MVGKEIGALPSPTGERQCFHLPQAVITVMVLRRLYSSTFLSPMHTVGSCRMLSTQERTCDVLRGTCGHKVECNCLVQCSTIPDPNLHTTDSETIHWGGLSTHTYIRHNHANPPGWLHN
ncbi:hypothetical protein ILYODFUR_031140 [Ilyodon furcidens]|uniref:Uncharacterized protein n=1 Tax=Ilyodon furcidens TaxID=33524 RepID=A0ABV0V8J3_9TELE